MLGRRRRLLRWGGCFPSDENVLEMVVMVAGLCADTKNCFDRVNFTVCGFYLKFFPHSRSLLLPGRER